MYQAALKRVALESSVIIPWLRQFVVDPAQIGRGNPYEWEMPRSIFVLSKEA